MGQWALGYYGHLCGDRLQEPDQLTGNGHDHLAGMFPACHQASVAFAQSHVRFPASEFPSPREPGQWDRTTAVGFDPVPGLFGH
jgi:hypothetical protein